MVHVRLPCVHYTGCQVTDNKACSGSHQLIELVVGFEAPQEAAELVVVGVLLQPRLRPQNVPGSRDQVVEKGAAGLLRGK